MTMNGKEIKYGSNLYIDTKEESPEIVTKITGIDFSEILVKGSQWLSPISKKVIKNKFHEKNMWIYKSRQFDNVTEWNLEKSIQEVLMALNKSKEKCRDIFSTYTGSYILTYLYIKDYHISFNLTANTVQELNYYGLGVVFDLYSLSEKEE
jgi:hypothetical protein